MSCSWVMVWIPTKTLEKRNFLEKNNLSQTQRIRLFSDSSTITEGSEVELQQSSLEVPSSPTNRPSRGDVFLTQSSHEKTIDSPSYITETSRNQNSDVWDPARQARIDSIDAGDNIPLAAASKNTHENALIDVLTSLNVSKAISQKSKDNNFALVTFCVENDMLEETIIRLGERGIGNTHDTSISILPTSVHVAKPETQIGYVYYNREYRIKNSSFLDILVERY